MCVYKMTAKELIETHGSSKGSQIKFMKDNYWYKIDECGPEGAAEAIVSDLLSFSTLMPTEYVHYEKCDIEYEGKLLHGCRSKNFLKPGETLFSYQKVYEMMTGRNLTEELTKFGTPKERIEFVASIMKSFSGLDVQDYIAKNLTIDMLFLNTDRHLNNFGIIADISRTKFRNAPIYDNGASLLSNYNVYPPYISVRDIANEDVMITGKPFAANLEYQAVAAGLSVKFNFKAITEYVQSVPDNRMKAILQYQLNKYQKSLDLGERQIVREEPSLILMCGLPGSGKTEMATKLCRQLRNPYELISATKERDDFYNKYACLDYESIFSNIRTKMRDAFADGKTVVLDASNLHREHRLQYLNIAEQYHIHNREIVVLDIPLETIQKNCVDFHISITPERLHDLKYILEREYPSRDEGWTHVKTETSFTKSRGLGAAQVNVAFTVQENNSKGKDMSSCASLDEILALVRQDDAKRADREKEIEHEDIDVGDPGDGDPTK